MYSREFLKYLLVNSLLHLFIYWTAYCLLISQLQVFQKVDVLWTKLYLIFVSVWLLSWSSYNYYSFLILPSVLWHYRLDVRTITRPVKKLSDRCWHGYLSVNDLHVVVQLMPLPPFISCFSKIEIGSTFLVPAYPGCPRKEAIKWVCVCYFEPSACVAAERLFYSICCIWFLMFCFTVLHGSLLFCYDVL